MAFVANFVLVVASLVLAVRLGKRWLARKNPVNFWYGSGLLLTAVASFCDFLSHLLGHAPLFWYGLYWVSAGSLVGFLGVGSAYLAHRRFGQVYALVAVGLTVWLIIAVVSSLGGQASSLALRPDLFTVSPNATIKLPFVLQSAVGGTIIFVGALLSAWRYRSLPALAIAAGAAVFSSGGTVAGWFQNALGMFYWTQVVGIVLLWWGVERSLMQRGSEDGGAGKRAVS